MSSIQRHRTALHRAGLSRPIRQALDDGLVDESTEVFDYGCGRGGDVSRLRAVGIEAHGWDPAFARDEPRREADLVNLGFVVNVIEDPDERAATLRAAWALAREVLIVAARLTFEVGELAGTVCDDGVRTSRHTFQRLYSQEELREWVDATLGATSMAAAPGIFYVFRRPARQQAVLAARFRRRVVVPRGERLQAEFEANRDALEALIAFMSERGRLPRSDEPGPAAEIAAAVGSVPRGLAIVRQVVPEQHWAHVARVRAQDLLVYLALARFGGRAKLTELTVETQHDVKVFFGSYREACARADRLLFAAGGTDTVDLACRASGVGKLTPTALYVHTTALGRVPAVLRVYEGCARVLTGSVGEATLVKLHRQQAKVSYLAYPAFDRDPHPSLAWSLVADLPGRRLGWRSYEERGNPPVLHRKETFVADDHPRRALFARLTAAEERAGLFAETDRIGTRDGWTETLARHGVAIRGHRLVPNQEERTVESRRT